MKRFAILLFGVTGYAIFFATFLYLIAFVTGLDIVPRHVDGGGPAGTPLGLAIAINVGLIGLFGIQHLIMARPGFKAVWTRIVPEPIERTVFMLATCAVLGLLFWQWRPIPDVIWSVDGLAGDMLLGMSFAGWGLALVSTFLIDHFDLFGLRQTWLAFRGRPYTQKAFQERSLYRVVRHPLMLGFLVAFWATPTMTVGHLVFAATFTTYVLIALRFEERDLIRLHGDAYVDYARRVPGLVPFVRPGSGRRETPEASA